MLCICRSRRLSRLLRVDDRRKKLFIVDSKYYEFNNLFSYGRDNIISKIMKYLSLNTS